MEMAGVCYIDGTLTGMVGQSPLKYLVIQQLEFD